MTQTFSTLRAANAARQAEWDPSDKITLAYRGNEMGGECGEAQNVIKKLERERLGIPGSRASIDQLAEELADVVICADLIAMGEGIDLDLAVAHKFNLTSEKVGLETRLAIAPYGWIANCVDGETHWNREKSPIWTEGGDEPEPATLEQLLMFAQLVEEAALRHQPSGETPEKTAFSQGYDDGYEDCAAGHPPDCEPSWDAHVEVMKGLTNPALAPPNVDQSTAFIVWNEGRSEGVIFTDLDREPGEPTAEDDAATASLGDHGSISSVLAGAFHEAFEDDNDRPIERIALSMIRGDG